MDFVGQQQAAPGRLGHHQLIDPLARIHKAPAPLRQEHQRVAGIDPQCPLLIQKKVTRAIPGVVPAGPDLAPARPLESGQSAKCRRPDDSLMIARKGVHRTGRKALTLRITYDFPVLEQARTAEAKAEKELAGRQRQQRGNIARREPLARRGFIALETDPMEAKQARRGAQPQVAIDALRQCDNSTGCAVLRGPSGVMIFSQCPVAGIGERRPAVERNEPARTQGAGPALKSRRTGHFFSSAVNARRQPSQRDNTDGERYAVAAGTFNSSSVPAPAPLQMVSLAPILCARSRIPDNPQLPGRPPASSVAASMPCPSSRTRMRNSRRSKATSTSICCARAWANALASASRPMR